MEKAQTAFEFAAALLDPTGQSVAGGGGGTFTPERLNPYMNLAYRRLRRGAGQFLEVAESEFVVTLPGVPIGTTDLSGYTKSGGMLANLIRPTKIFERQAGGTAEDYTEVSRVDILPDRSPDSLNYVYQFRSGTIYMVGSTQAEDLEVHYEGLWAAINGTETPLAALDIADILGYWTAALMGDSIGHAKSADWLQLGDAQWYLWLIDRVKAAQAVVRQPGSFGTPHAGSGGFMVSHN